MSDAGEEAGTQAGRTALVVINAQSRGAKKAEPYLERLEAGGMTLIRRDCGRRNRLPEIITEMRHTIDCVILGGGGGTMSAAAIALRDTGLPLGIIPLGTDNHLARTLGLPTDPEGATGIILAGHTRAVDIGSVNGQPFFNVATVGLTIDDARRLHAAATSRLGLLTYFWAALRVVIGVKRFSAIIRAGGTIYRVRTMQIAIGNGHPWRGGMQMTSEPPTGDHQVDVYSLEPGSKWSLLLMPDAFGDEARPGETARAFRCPVVEVVTRLPLPILVDGDSITVTPARFSVLPGAVTIYAPQNPPSDDWRLATDKPYTPAKRTRDERTWQTTPRHPAAAC